jgi:alpha-amylase/alpha-mannosidase (GH57 family)
MYQRPSSAPPTPTVKKSIKRGRKPKPLSKWQHQEKEIYRQISQKETSPSPLVIYEPITYGDLIPSFSEFHRLLQPPNHQEDHLSNLPCDLEDGHIDYTSICHDPSSEDVEEDDELFTVVDEKNPLNHLREITSVIVKDIVSTSKG